MRDELDTVTIQCSKYIERLKKYNSSKQWADAVNLIHEGLKPRAKVLDFGSGLGTLCFILKQDGHNPCGVEANVELLRLSKRTFTDIKFHSYKQWLHFDKNEYDAIFMLSVLEHVENVEFVLRKMRTMLKLRGKVVILQPSYAYRVCMKPKNWYIGYKDDPTMLHMWTMSGLKKIMHECGFEYETHKKLGKRFLGIPESNLIVFI